MFELENGNLVELTRSTWRQIKEIALLDFDGSLELFNASWREYRNYLNGSIDNPDCQLDVNEWIEQIASVKVNDPKSKFYIYG